MEGMITCKVCGKDFPLMAEEHYIAQDPQRVGVLANLTSTDKAMEYDAFDCPHCGCQNVVQSRKPLWMPETCEHDGDEESENESEDESEESSESAEYMRGYLVGFCRHRWCAGCPLVGKDGFKCGRGFGFSSKPDEKGYIPDEELKRYYKVVEEGEYNE